MIKKYILLKNKTYNISYFNFYCLKVISNRIKNIWLIIIIVYYCLIKRENMENLAQQKNGVN